MSQGGYGDHSQPLDAGKRRMVLNANLLQAVRGMHDIDELFQWLLSALVQSFDIAVVQFWTAQVDYAGQTFMHQLAIGMRDNFFSQHIALNKPVADLAQALVSRRTHLALNSISSVFSYYQANLFQRYGLYYCFGNYLNMRGQLPASGPTGLDQGKLASMDVAALLFCSQIPPIELQRDVYYILKLAMQLAETKRLLLPPTVALRRMPDNRPPSQQDILSKLVPRHKENTQMMTTSTPLANTLIIADKLARRLYQAIDGRKTVKELCIITRLDAKEATLALRSLLTEQRIEVFDLTGQRVDSSVLLNDL